MSLKTTALTAAALIGAAVMSAPTHAATFADYSPFGSGQNLDFISGFSGGSAGADAETFFDFLTLGPVYQHLAAIYTFDAFSSDSAVSAGGYDIQPGLGGNFSFIYNGPNVGALVSGENLLSGAFSGVSIAGPNLGSTASLQDSILSGGTVTFTSDVLSFSSAGDKGISIELTSILPGLIFSHGVLTSFSGVSSGSFASGASVRGGGGGVPEPASWALMLLGFAGIGCACRLSPSIKRTPLA